MSSSLPVTIVINNFNYARYLGSAIESALAQTYPWTEVLVVDDGSTDDSHAVIDSYGGRVDSVFKENGGQASALNVGFAHSSGAIVIFLDADDLLHPEVVERVSIRFRANPHVVRVQYRLEVIDADGLSTGAMIPPRQISIPSGDLRRQVLLYADDIPWLPTSGNAFSSQMLQRIFPVPESVYRICADYYLSNLSPLYGLVASLDETGGYYRVHDSNNHQKEQLELGQTREIIIRTLQTHKYVQERAQQLGFAGLAGNDVGALSVTFPANRLVSLRLARAQHPIASDGRFALARRGMLAAWRRADLPLLLRGVYISWFLLVLVVPQRAVRWLAEQLFYPESRGHSFNMLLSFLRGATPVRKK